MPRYAVPRFLEYVSELDKTPTGKLRKQDLRDAGITDNTMGPRKHRLRGAPLNDFRFELTFAVNANLICGRHHIGN